MKKEYQKPEMYLEPIEIESNLMVSSLPVGDDIGNDQYSNIFTDIDIWENTGFQDIWK